MGAHFWLLHSLAVKVYLLQRVPLNVITGLSNQSFIVTKIENPKPNIIFKIKCFMESTDY